MKNMFLTKWMTALIICQACFITSLSGEEIIIPVVTKPTELLEGTETKLSESQIQELLPWAHDAKFFLKDLMENIQTLNSKDKHERLIEGIKYVVKESSPKNNELFMRYILNRSLVVDDILTREMTADAVGTIDIKIQILKKSIEMAMKYFDLDIKRFDQKTLPDFATFGNDYFKFLNQINKSIFDASAQYTIYRMALDWVKWDLNRDLNNKGYAPAIVKIHHALKLYKEKPGNDADSIAQIRQLKRLIQQISQSLPGLMSKNIPLGGGTIKVGDAVSYTADGSSNPIPAEIIAIQNEDEMVTVRFENNEVKANIRVYDIKTPGNERIYFNKGCSDESVCIGEEMFLINSSGDIYEVVVLGRTLSRDNNVPIKYIVFFKTGKLKDKIGGGWTFHDNNLAKKTGCYENFCVGDKVINKQRNASAEIVGIQKHNRFVLHFTSGGPDLVNKFGDNWSAENLIKEGQ